MKTRSRFSFSMTRSFLPVIAWLGLLCSVHVHALTEIDDKSLSGVSGSGLAISLTNYQTGWGATSYLEAVGTNVTNATLLSYGFVRGDAYWYGGTYSGTTNVRAWAGTCGAGIGNLGCPMGGLIGKFAPYDNPLLLRVFNYYQSPAGYQLLDYSGNTITSANPQTIFEVLGPTKQDPFKFSFWAEERVGAGQAPTSPGTTGTLQSQVIMGNSTLTSPVNGTPGNNKIRLFQTTNPSDQTLGIIWENHYSGDFRFSVNQQTLSAGLPGIAPMFSDYEGFYGRNIKTYVPLGQLFYQSLIFDDTVPGLNTSYNSAVNKGDFVIELTAIPNTANVYNDFYGYTGSYTDGGAFTPQTKSTRYNETHGYFTVGTIGTNSANAFFRGSGAYAITGGTLNNCNGTSGTAVAAGSACFKDTNDGVFFSAWHPTNTSAQFVAFANRPAYEQYHTIGNGGDPTPLPYYCGSYQVTSNCGSATGTTNMSPNAGTDGFKMNAVNLGDVSIQGMLIQHLKITSLGAGG